MVTLVSDHPEMDRDAVETAFSEYYSHLRGQQVPAFEIRFFPYSNLSHTIRGRQGKIFVRISDILSNAPAEVLTAVLIILLHKLFSDEPAPEGYRKVYRSYVSQDEVRLKIRWIRSQRGRKHLTSEQGQVFDLRQIFHKLNRQYFSERIDNLRLSWSRRRGRRVLGHYDPAHRTIVINQRLDHALVPKLVLEYVLYHEMLHAFLGDRCRSGRRSVHDRNFCEAEKRFHHYALAREFIRSSLF